jgi:hypothetical protein
MQHSQAAQEAVLAATQIEIDALFEFREATAELRVAPAPVPAHRIDRTAAARKHSRHGVVVGGAEWAAARADSAARASSSAAKKVASELKFWESRRADVRAAERALAEQSGDPSLLSVGQLKALIVSRTGKTASAKNNKEGAMLIEARAALDKQSATLIPATPPRAQPLVGCADDDGEGSGDDDGGMTSDA